MTHKEWKKNESTWYFLNLEWILSIWGKILVSCRHCCCYNSRLSVIFLALHVPMRLSFAQTQIQWHIMSSTVSTCYQSITSVCLFFFLVFFFVRFICSAKCFFPSYIIIFLASQHFYNRKRKHLPYIQYNNVHKNTFFILIPYEP